MKKGILLLIGILFIESCQPEYKDIEGKNGSYKYFIDSYINPSDISLLKGPSNKSYVKFNSGILINVVSGKKFKDIAREHGESGETIFRYWKPPYSRVPYGIKKISFFIKDPDGKLKDVSNDVTIICPFYRLFIQSGYKADYTYYEKKVNHLTKEDLMYLVNPLEINLDKLQAETIIIKLFLEDGRIITKQK